MSRLSNAAGLSLLARELRETASRPGTHAFRALAAALLLAAFAAGAWRADPLGAGSALFSHVLLAQYAIVYLLLPGMMAGAVAEERERGTLPLLVITPIGSWGILLAKYAGRLLPPLTLLCLGLPLMGAAYTLGGVEREDLAREALFLLLALLQAGAAALLASCSAPSLASAVVRAYLGAAAGALLLPGLYYWLMGGPAGDWRAWVAAGIPSLLCTALLLRAAGRRLVRLARGERRPPEWHPVTRRGLLLRDSLLTAAMVATPIFSILLAVLLWQFRQAMGLLLLALWAIGLMVLIGQGTRAFARDRVRGGLDVLLATPMSGSSIVRRRAESLNGGCAVVVGILCVLPWLRASAGQGGAPGEMLYVVGWLLSVAVVSPLVSWFALWVGLVLRGQARAGLVAAGCLLAWALLPLVLVGLADLAGFWRLLYFLSPAAVPLGLELAPHQVTWLAVLAAAAWQAGCLVAIRWWVLSRADRWLGRPA